jgi:antitoxin (DNA-binding transcriptional repressor) of toxin-antitoxin stability system
MEGITATEAARRLSDLLNRVRYRGERFQILRGGEVVAQLVPAVQTSLDVQGLCTLLGRLRSVDDRFASDLERIQAEQPPAPGDPWDT